MTPKTAANTLAYIALFLLGIMVGHDFKKPPVNVTERPYTIVYEQDCFMEHEDADLRLITVDDLSEL